MTKWLFLIPVALLLLGVSVVMQQKARRHAISDQTVRQATQERLPIQICLPTYVELGQVVPLPMDEQTAREVADLSALELVQADAEATGPGQLLLRPTAKGQPLVRSAKLCLAQASYGHLRSVADVRVDDDGHKVLNAKIDPLIEPLPGAAADWLKQIHKINAIRGLDAELVDTSAGWRARSASLY